MAIYHIVGIVHPEKALLNYVTPMLDISIGTLQCNITNNQVYGTFEANDTFMDDISTLRNIIKNHLQEEISIWSYIFGTGYDIEIVRITETDKEDKVYGVSVACIEKRNLKKIKNIRNELLKIHSVYRENSNYAYYIQRCFSELNKAIRFPSDTGFHCYRAIESLRNYCGRKYNIFQPEYPEQKKSINTKNESDAWEKLNELTKVDRRKIESWRDDLAFHARHGEHKNMTDAQRQEIFLTTWDVVDAFIDSQYNI